MSGNPIFDYTIPAIMRALRVVDAYLDRLQARIDAGQLAEGTVLAARLAPDMLPFVDQIRLVTENAKNGPARLTGKFAPLYNEVDTTIAQLKARVARTRHYVQSFRPVDFLGAEERKVNQSFRQVGYSMRGGDYLREVLLPNFYFHVTAAHAILRTLGVDIGKADYLAVSERPEEGEDEGPYRYVTAAEGRGWLQERGVSPEVLENPTVFGTYVLAGRHEHPEAPRVVEVLGDTFGGYGQSLIYLTNWSLAGGHDHDPTENLRLLRHDGRSLSEAPGVVFDASSGEEALKQLLLLVRRGWSVRICRPDARVIATVEPDIGISIYTSDLDIADAVAQVLKRTILADPERSVECKITDEGHPIR